MAVILTQAAELARRAVVFKGLTSAKQYTATVTAVTKAGASDPVQAKAGVA